MYYFIFMFIFIFYIILYSFPIPSPTRLEHGFLRILYYLCPSVQFTNDVSIVLQTLRDSLLLLSSNFYAATATEIYGPFACNDMCNYFQRSMSLVAVCRCLKWPWQQCLWANMGPIWGRQGPGGPHVGPINFAIWRPLTPIFFLMCVLTMLRLPVSIWILKRYLVPDMHKYLVSIYWSW